MNWKRLVGRTLAGAALVCLGPALAAETESERQEPGVLVIHAGTVIAVPGSEVLTDQTIVVSDERIAAVRDGFVDPSAAADSDSAQVEFLDLRDAVLLPGLMDMHVHLSMEFGVEGQRSYGVSDPYAVQHRVAKDDAYFMVNAIDNARKTLEAGFTTVRNVGADGWHIFALRDGIRDGLLTGPRIITAGHHIRLGADEGPGACWSVESCRRATRVQIDMGADLIKVVATCSGSKPCGNQFAPAVILEDEFRAIVEVAGTRGLKVAAHAHGTDGINLAARLGAWSIEHGSFNNAESHRIMRENGVYLVPTLAVQDIIRADIGSADDEMAGLMRSFLDNHGPRILAAHKAGVTIAAGTDAGVTKHGNNARELELYVEHGLTPEEAIVTATVNAAAAIGMEDELGTVEPGRIADLIAVAGDPLTDISVLMNVQVVIQGGRVVKDAR
ncbi:MAG: amidohydrolase family protein [Gammaproteobacteria bacterium]|nr:amidohydrolase family protein [Gammaproteobacteria bacterium]